MALAGHRVRGAKSGPDFIDPRFHQAATGRASVNLDAWAMRPARLRALAAGPGLLVAEGAMGLFDGAPPDGRGSSADLAAALGLPVLLIVDAGRMSQSVLPLVAGFAGHDRRISVGGVILNRVGSARHERILRHALSPLPVPVLGAIPRLDDLHLPSRHLGLLQAGETDALDAFIDRAATICAAHVDLGAILTLAKPMAPAPTRPLSPPPARTIALADDIAFSFSYPHLLDDWQAAGAEIRRFSPLRNDPVPPADLVFLPGGYPELHAARLSLADVFLNSLRNAAQQADIYGECGGYMVLGEGLVDADGTRHAMAGLLPLETSFADTRLHLGYRRVSAAGGSFPGTWAAHEFHYSTALSERGPRLFQAEDAEGNRLEPMGLIRGRVSGSYAHLIDRFSSP